MKGWKEIKSTQKTWRREAIAGTFLFVLTIIGVVFIIISNEKATALAEASWQSTMDATEVQMTVLRDELVELDRSYTGQLEENQVLQTDIAEKLVEISALKQKVAEAQKQLKASRKDSEAIRAKLAQLEEIKVGLEADLVTLHEQNAGLEQTNGQLRDMIMASEIQADKMQGEIAHLTATNHALEARIAQIAPAGFVADNFVITALRRNNKLTAKASQAEMINVVFDLQHVPLSYDRDHELYLVLTDFAGHSLEHVPSTTTTVRTSDGQWPVEAADIENVKIVGDQMISMTIAPETDLEPGSYHLLVYADNGFLGATGFQLR